MEKLAGALTEAEIVATTTALLGQHLAVDRCCFLEADEVAGEITVREAWRRAGLAALPPVYRVADLVQPDAWEVIEARAVAVEDVRTHPLTRPHAPTLEALGVRAFAACPCGVARPRGYVLGLVNAQPRAWTTEEILLLDRVVARVWPRVERARANAALQASEAHFRLALSIAKLGDWTWDAVTDEATLSARAAEIFGVPAERTMKRAEMLALTHPDDRERVATAVKNALVARTDYDVEYRVQRRGMLEEVWVAGKGRARYSPQGELLGVMGVVQDISERKRDEAKREAHERELNLISAHAPAILSHWDREHRLIFASHAFADRWGKRPSDLIGQTVAEILGESAFAALQPHLQRVLSGVPVLFEMEVPYDHLGRRYVQASCAPDIGPEGQVRGYLAAVLDMTDRRRAEIALFESEERLRMATRTGKVGLWDWEIATGRVMWTESLYEIHGVRPSEFDPTAENFTALIHPDDRAPVQRAIQSALEHRTPYELEFRAVRPNGTIVWLFTNAVVLREDDRPVHMIGATLDVTARKTAELGLRDSESRFRALASHAPVGIFLTNPAGETIFVNEAWSKMVGATPEQSRGREWMSNIHPDDRDRVIAGWEKALREEKPADAEYRFRRPDGAITWVQGHAVPLRDARGNRSGYIGTIADVTQRKNAESKLRAQEAELRLISTNAPIILSHCDLAQRFLFVNRAYATRFGLTPPDIVGRKIEDVLGLDAYAVIEPYIERVLAGESVEFEVEVPYRELGRRFMRSAYVPDLAADGSVRGWLSAVSDVTEHKQTEEALRLAQGQLQRHATELEQKVEERTTSLRNAIAQMEEFSYSVSHDLRAPLRAINAYAQALVEDYSDRLDATGKDYLERIRRSSQRMENLTHDVLTYSRVAQAEMRLSPLNLEPLLGDLVSQYAELQSPAADVAIARPLLRVMAHESSLGQSLANLLTNATKFVAPGVRPGITVRTERVGDRVRVWIEDNGVGIAPQYHARLFRVFERAPNSQSYEGTGIGLAIVRKAIEKMGGSCGIESDGRTGSRFWIELLAAPV